MDDAISRSATLAIVDRHIDFAMDNEMHYAMCCVGEEIKELSSIKADGNTSDGYHTFNELYDHRAKLFSVIVRDHSELCWKSKLHHDGTMYDGMFIVGINTPNGQASYHYDIDPYWDMFECKEMERAPVWDGHTPEEAINRIAALDVAPVVHARWIHCKGKSNLWYCSECGDKMLYNPTRRTYNITKLPMSEKNKFCRNCGARMDGEIDA